MGEEGKATQHQGKSEEACRELRIHRLAADADADRLAADDDRVLLQKSLQAENLGRGGKCRLSSAQADSFFWNIFEKEDNFVICEAIYLIFLDASTLNGP